MEAPLIRQVSDHHDHRDPPSNDANIRSNCPLNITSEAERSNAGAPDRHDGGCGQMIASSVQGNRGSAPLKPGLIGDEETLIATKHDAGCN